MRSASVVPPRFFFFTLHGEHDHASASSGEVGAGGGLLGLRLV
jgi:hypothetical protein